jgi:hypothetical protein
LLELSTLRKHKDVDDLACRYKKTQIIGKYSCRIGEIAISYPGNAGEGWKYFHNIKES